MFPGQTALFALTLTVALIQQVVGIPKLYLVTVRQKAGGKSSNALVNDPGISSPASEVMKVGDENAEDEFEISKSEVSGFDYFDKEESDEDLKDEDPPVLVDAGEMEAEGEDEPEGAEEGTSENSLKTQDAEAERVQEEPENLAVLEHLVASRVAEERNSAEEIQLADWSAKAERVEEEPLGGQSPVAERIQEETLGDQVVVAERVEEEPLGDHTATADSERVKEEEK